MCLDRVDIRYNPPDPSVRWVRKEFTPVDGKLHFWFMDYNEDPHVPVGRWIKAEHKPVYYGDGIRGAYCSGFHTYLEPTKPDDWRMNLFRVKVRNVRTVGVQEGCEVLVGDEMYVPRRCAWAAKLRWWQYRCWLFWTGIDSVLCSYQEFGDFLRNHK